MQKRFGPADFLALERYLSSQHAKGMRFCGTSFGGRLRFEHGKPEHAVYRMDYREAGTDKAAYIASCANAGWEHCGKIQGWECLRRRSVNDTALKDGLFHDSLERAKWRRSRAGTEALLGVLPLVVFCLAWSWLKQLPQHEIVVYAAALCLIAAFAISWPAYQVRVQCSRVMEDWHKRHEKL